MRQLRLAILVLIIGLVMSTAAKTVSGSISEDTNWSGEILVDGTVVIERGVTLTIKPGTRIKFAPKQHPREKGIEFVVFGKVLARGTEGSGQIYFTSASNDRRMHDWYGIVFKSSENYSELRNCVVEYAYSGIRCIGSSPIISGSTIQYNYYSGINCEVRSHPQITLSKISQNGMMGIHCELYSNPVIESCDINKNANGIAVYDFSLPDLGNVNPESGQSAGNNQIHGNFEFDVYNHSQNSIMTQNNFWKSDDPEQIRSKIYDRRKNAKYGSVSFLPMLDEAPKQDLRDQSAARLAMSRPVSSDQPLDDLAMSGGSSTTDLSPTGSSTTSTEPFAGSETANSSVSTPKTPGITRTPVRKPPVKQPEPEPVVAKKPPVKKTEPVVTKKPPVKQPEPEPVVAKKPPVKKPEPEAVVTKKPEPVVAKKPPVKKPEPVVTKKPPVKQPEPEPVVAKKPPVKKPEPVVSKTETKPVAASRPSNDDETKDESWTAIFNNSPPASKESENADKPAPTKVEEPKKPAPKKEQPRSVIASAPPAGSNGHSDSNPAEDVNYNDFLSEVKEVLKVDDSADNAEAETGDDAAPYLASSDRGGSFPEASRPSGPAQLRQQDPFIESMLDGGKREYLRRDAPDYPRIHLKSGSEGTVLIEVIVGRDGRLKNYRILRSDGEAFSDAAVRALKKYRYKTGTVEGIPVNFRIVERFEFKLNR